jgi:hypothetical protein
MLVITADDSQIPKRKTTVTGPRASEPFSLQVTNLSGLIPRILYRANIIASVMPNALTQCPNGMPRLIIDTVTVSVS